MRGELQRFDLDNPPIKSIGWFSEPEFHTVEVGLDGITRIDCKQLHCGDYCVYWLQVWAEDKLVVRYNAKNVDTIMYEEIE